MIDLTSIKPYLLPDAGFFTVYAEKNINNLGFDNWFETELDVFLNCKKLLSNGNRSIQTNLRQYKIELTTIVSMIDKYANNKDYYYEKLIEQHNSNLEFEAVNGLEYDITLINRKKSTRNKNKQTSINFEDKPKKETVAERKLKAHVAKIKSLNIKIKPVKHDDTL